MAVQASVTLDPKEMARIERYLRAVNPKINARGLWKPALTRMADLTQKEAGTEIMQGRGKDAPPDKPPRQLTGRTNALLRSIEPDYSEIPRLSSVGTALLYGGVHEFGGIKKIRASMRKAHSRKQRGKTVQVKAHSVSAHTAKFPRRPYLEPGLNSAQKRFGDIMVAVLGDELRKVDKGGRLR